MISERNWTYVSRLSAVIFWSAASLAFLTQMELGDVWWHLKTGELIWQRMAIPQTDDFSIAFYAPTPFVLRAFWLAQVIFYLVQHYLGFYGLIALKSSIFVTAFCFIHHLIGRHGLRPPLSYLLMLPMIAICTEFDEIRPQTVSIAFFAATLYLLESWRLEAGAGRRYRPILWLLPMMLIWSNMHPGYVSGGGIICLYAAWELFLSGHPRGEKRFFILAALGALACSALNPNGPAAYMTAAGIFHTAATGHATIHEILPLKEFTEFTGQHYLYFEMLAFIALGAASFVWAALRKRRIDWLYAVAFAGLAYASLTTFRAGLFLSLFGTAIIAGNLAPGDGRVRARLLHIPLAAGLVALIALWLVPRSIVRQPVLPETLIPSKTAEFILADRPPANIFHPYEWGGYMIWALYPHYRAFIDSRNSFDDYDTVADAAPGWQAVLDKYKVNTVVFWPLLPFKGNVSPIVLALLKDDGWSPVYWDLGSVAFVRTPLAGRTIEKSSIWELLQSLVTRSIELHPKNADNYVSLGQIYYERGLRSMARAAFARALSMDPHNREAARWAGMP